MMGKSTRTEEEVLCIAPLKVKLGLVEYDLPVLAVLNMRKWRMKLAQEISAMAGILRGDAVNASVVVNGLGFAFTQFPDKVLDLVFIYAGEALNRPAVESVATEEQFALAFSKIMQVAFPFAEQMGMVMMALKSAETTSSASPAESSTNSHSPTTL